MRVDISRIRWIGFHTGIIDAGGGAKAIDISGGSESVKRTAGFDRRFEGSDRRCDQLYPPSNLRLRNRKQGLTDAVAVGPISGDEVIIIKIDFTQQAIATSVRTHAIIHSDALQTQNRRSAFGANPVPGVAIPIVIKWVDARIRTQIVIAVGYRRICVNAAGISPTAECVCRILNCLANFGIGDVTAGLRGVERLLPTADLARGRIVPGHAIQEHISANERNNQDCAQDTQQHVAARNRSL